MILIILFITILIVSLKKCCYIGLIGEYILAQWDNDNKI